MFCVQCSLVLVILNIFVIQGLVPLPVVEDNVLLKTKEVIQLTTNTLLHLIIPKTFRNTKLKKYFQIHNYFISLTVQDYYNLQEIAKLTRVNVNCNFIFEFITVINEIIEEEYDLKLNTFTIFNKNNEKERKINYLLSRAFFDDQGVKNDGIKKEVLNILQDGNIQIDRSNSILENGSLNKDDGDPNLDERYWRQDSDTSTVGRRLYNGRKTKISNFGFMASVLIFGRFQCAGSIIAKDLVITAASCLQLAHNNRFYRENPKFLSVRVGSTYSNFGGEVIDVLEINFHPSYVPNTLRHNLAIMRLQRHLKFNNKFVKMIAIDAKRPLKRGKVTVVGWGAKSEGSLQSAGGGRLRYAQLDPYDLRECRKIYSKQYVRRNNFCAGFVSRGGGACNKDVGGPGIIGTTLVGVISFGAPVCGTPDAPTVFEKLSHYRNWINDIMDQDVPYLETRTTTRRPYKYLYETPVARTATWTISPLIDKEAIRATEKIAITGTDSEKTAIRGIDSEKTAIRGIDSDKSFAKYKYDPKFDADSSGGLRLGASVAYPKEKITKALYSSEEQTYKTSADFAITPFGKQTTSSKSLIVPQYVSPVKNPRKPGQKDKEIDKLMQIVGDTVNKTALEIDAEILNLKMKENMLRFVPREHATRQTTVKPKTELKIEDYVSVLWELSTIKYKYKQQRNSSR